MSATVNATTPGSGPDLLRQRVDEFVGLFFYGTMLKSVREHPMTKAKIGTGGRGEDVFGSQLDEEFAQRSGEVSNNSLSDAIVRRIAGKSAGPTLPKADLTSSAAGAAGAWAGSAANSVGRALDVTQ